MRAWHWGFILAVILAYFVGVKFPATGTAVLGKVGM
jgi:hypothetical protein